MNENLLNIDIDEDDEITEDTVNELSNGKDDDDE